MSAANCFKDVFDPKVTGHDIANAYLLMMTNRLLFPDQLGAVIHDRADVEQKFRDRFKPLGIDIFSFFHDTPGQIFDTNGVVMSNDRIVIVAFRGTEINAGWAKFIADLVHTDLNRDMVSLPSFGNGAKVHEGFWAAFDQVRSDVLDEVQEQGSAGQKVWVTGHSLGGAQALLAASTLRNEGIPVQGLYTYGSPRVGNETFNASFGIGNTQRYVYALDIVPMMPDDILRGYRHVGRTNNFEVPFLPFAGPYDSVLKLNSQEVKGLGNFDDHDLARYEAALFHHLSAGEQGKVPKPALQG